MVKIVCLVLVCMNDILFQDGREDLKYDEHPNPKFKVITERNF